MYICISVFFVFSLVFEIVVVFVMCVLDKFDVLLVISSVKFGINIILDFFFILIFYVGSYILIVNMQVGIQLVCNMVVVICGLVYFFWRISWL